MKEFLSKQNPTINELLPEGTIKRLHLELDINKDVLSRMLRGHYGTEAKLEPIVSRVIQILEEKGEEHLSTAKKLRNILAESSV